MENLQKYARLIVRTGVNISKGDTLVINSPVECYDFTRLMVAQGYEAGAKEVIVLWNDEIVTRDTYLYGDDEIFKTLPQWRVDMMMDYQSRGAAFISISSSDPALLKDVEPSRLKTANEVRSKALKAYSDALMSNKNRWNVVSIPTKKWATKVFPDCSEQEAIDRLWDAIFSVTRTKTEDPVKAWQEHNTSLNEKVTILNDYHFDHLVYTNSLGTNLEVKLPKTHHWVGGGDKDVNGVDFIANIPTEEVYTCPQRDGVNGIVYSALPLSYSGSIIEDFYLKFENGRIIEYGAKTGLEALTSLIETDEGSHYIGEVALVPYHSPISDLGITFYNTLYDENASCHFAIGESYGVNLEGGNEHTTQQKLAAGGNTSLTHVDFMIGTKDLNIIGYKNDQQVVIFKDGNWAI